MTPLSIIQSNATQPQKVQPKWPANKNSEEISSLRDIAIGICWKA